MFGTGASLNQILNEMGQPESTDPLANDPILPTGVLFLSQMKEMIAAEITTTRNLSRDAVAPINPPRDDGNPSPGNDGNGKPDPNAPPKPGSNPEDRKPSRAGQG